MKNNVFRISKTPLPPETTNNWYQSWVSFGENIDESYFLEQLRIEKLRAQRSKFPLSIVLLTLDKEADNTLINLREILGFVRKIIRNTDISGLVSHNAIGILLPDTEEKGAKELCAKLMHGYNMPKFSTSTSTYPDDIFESLGKHGYILPDAFPFGLEASQASSRFKLSLKIKRYIDIIGSIIGILIFMPVMLITALAIKITSPGPVIFSQKRLGKQGIHFDFYKFRSMYVNADDQIHREYTKALIDGHHDKINQGNAEKPLYKLSSDPRITRVGRFIRKTSIDELPQFFNVLKGDMSLVGPRPPLAYEVEKYQAWHLRRILEMMPGITGLWQVEGRSKTGWDETVRLDILYIMNWSLLFDLKILFRTVMVLLKDRGAV